MYIDYTEDELLDKFLEMTTQQIIDYLMDEGLTLKAPKLSYGDTPKGIYRRKLGQDLIRHDGYGLFRHVEVYGPQLDETPITWTLSSRGDEWVLVLDELNKPVINGLEFRANKDGQRVG